jgi:hypothetical protein
MKLEKVFDIFFQHFLKGFLDLFYYYFIYKIINNFWVIVVVIVERGLEFSSVRPRGARIWAAGEEIGTTCRTGERLFLFPAAARHVETASVLPSARPPPPPPWYSGGCGGALGAAQSVSAPPPKTLRGSPVKGQHGEGRREREGNDDLHYPPSSSPSLSP